MARNSINERYFDWLCDLVCEDPYSDHSSFRKLLAHLHHKIFRYSILQDKDRAEDGIYLRYRFECDVYDSEPVLDDRPCSVLEMMIALAIRCEEDYMDDPLMGDRTAQWFWGMITNMGLGSMTDIRFDDDYVDDVVERFLDREYESDGRGGLFRIRNCECDVRDLEIWHQLCRYLGGIT